MTTTELQARIETHAVLPHRDRRAMWDRYTEAFEPLRKLAAQRHVMFHDEYTEMMDDDRVTKIVAYENDQPIGMATVTNDLKALPLIEPEYFAALEPELYARGHVWYTAFVFVRQGWPKAPEGTFRRLIDKVAEPIRPVRGVCYMDYAQCRADQGLPERANLLLALGHPDAECRLIDAQTYWSYYPGGRPS